MKFAIDMSGSRSAEMLARQVRNAAPGLMQTIGRGSVSATEGVIRTDPQGNMLAIIGTPIGRVDLSRIIDVQSATELLPRLDGAFVGAFWSAAERKLVLVTDFLGFKPLYMRRLAGCLELAGETKAWVAEPDPAGWGAFVSFGHTIGARTLLKGIKRVGPATIVVYDEDTDTLSERSYWQWPASGGNPETGALVERLAESIRLYAERGDPGTLLLSGGFDSRLVACLLKRHGVLARAVSVRHDEELLDADSRFAAALAKHLDIPLDRRSSPRDYFSSLDYKDYLFQSDAETPSLYLFISQVSQFFRGSSVWDGLVPGYTLKTTHQPAGAFPEYLRRECAGPDSTAWANAATVFGTEFCEAMRFGIDADLKEERERYPDDDYGVSQFIVRNRARNRACINTLKVYEAKSNAFLPGMTKDYFELAGRISFEARHQNALYLNLLRTHVPEALCCPIVSGSTLVHTSAWSPGYYANLVAAKTLKFATRYPSTVRWLGINPSQRAFAPSRFLDVDALLPMAGEEVDIRGLHARRDRLSSGESKLLFHWCAWREVHSDEQGWYRRAVP